MKLALTFLLLLALAARAAYTEFYCQTTGSNLNAGSTTADSALVTGTNGNWNGTDTYIFSGATDLSGVSAGMWGSLYNDGATVGVYVARIVTVNDGTDTLTFSTTAKSGTAPTSSATARSCKVGGAWDGPSGTVAFPFGFVQATATDVSGNPPRVNIKSGTDYAITAAMTHANVGPIIWEGYTTTEGDGGLAVIDGGATGVSYIPLTCSGNGNSFVSLWFKNNGDSGSATSQLNITGTVAQVRRCRFSGAWRSGLRIAAGGASVIECEAHGCNLDDAAAFGAFYTAEESVFIRCWSHDNTVGTDSCGYTCAADSGETVTYAQCVAENNASYGWETSGSHVAMLLINCDLVSNAEGGLDLRGLALTTASNLIVTNSNFVSNGGFGVDNDGVGINYPVLVNCGFFGNASGQTQNCNASFISGSVTYTGTPYTDSANGNVALNDTAGAGAAARNAGRGAFLQNGAVYSATTTSFPSIGAQQPDEPAGGGGGGKSSIFLR